MKCACKWEGHKVVSLCGAHDDFIKPIRAEIKNLKHDIKHYLLAFEELGGDSSALRQSECIAGKDCEFK